MTPYVTMVKLCIVHRFFASSHGAYIGNLANFITFNFKPLVIPPQLLEEFHNWVKCGQWTLNTHGCHYTTTLGSSTTFDGSTITGIFASIY
jgi:hypothetical protein